MNTLHVQRIGLTGCAIVIAWIFGNTVAAGEEPLQIQVFKSPTCVCCKPWVKYLVANGFTATVEDVEDIDSIKRKHGVPPQYSACHTALIGGYVIEGHVSVDEIRRLLAERPKIVGLAVRGMPKGAPGMEGPDPERYEVMALDEAGNAWVYATHDPSMRR